MMISDPTAVGGGDDNGTATWPGAEMSGGVTGRLRRTLDDARAQADTRVSMKDLTVLAPGNDPFRIDTPASHRDGAWLAMRSDELGLSGRTIHLRGLHYALIGVEKPNGQTYRNTAADWCWLQDKAADAARWLGYIPFDRIVDQRNSAPDVQILDRTTPVTFVSSGADVELPDVPDIEPYAMLWKFTGVQPFKIVLVGEKSSLRPVLGPVAETYGADLYLPTGCLSDTMIHTMARVGAADGRPMVVLYFSDCDPAGWNMPVEVARKLQAFKAQPYPSLDFQVRRVGLTPDQVREYGLPSTPLKESERRGDQWREAMGVQQTEIDALASLRPDLLDRITRDAVAPFYDSTLRARVALAESDWHTEAQAVVDAAVDLDHVAQLHADAVDLFDRFRADLDTLNDAVSVDQGNFDLPEPVIPDAVIPEDDGEPLVDSRWSFLDQCRALTDSKAYRVAS